MKNGGEETAKAYRDRTEEGQRQDRRIAVESKILGRWSAVVAARKERRQMSHLALANANPTSAPDPFGMKAQSQALRK